MSSIEKLLIRGIRSFSPDEPAVIEFYSPVTLIVGHNGAGKTTIIEGLKYATTGDLPPNSKGGAFVHDCKLYGATEVKAQVKLKFKNVRGQPMVVTRSLQLTMKASRTECKTLEGLLVTTDPHSGEQISLSSRVADLDLEVPLNLGVSPAVLENVIFCHQEDSLWPLAEPSVLKKKFDDIFAATKYTKALDTLKALRKQLLTDLKLEQQRLDQYKSDKEKANRLRAQLENTNRQLTVTTERIQGLQEHIDSSVVHMSSVSEDLKVANNLVSELERVRHESSLLDTSVTDLKSSGMREMPDKTDQDLINLLNQHSQVVQTSLDKQNQLRFRKENITLDINKCNAERNGLQVQMGTHNATLERLQNQWTLFSTKYGISDIHSVLSFIDQRQQDLNISESSFHAADEKFQNVCKMLADQSSQLLMKRTSLEEGQRQLRKQLDDTKQRLMDLDKQEMQCHSDFSNKDELEQLLIHEEALFRSLQTDLTNANYESRVQELQSQKHSKGDQIHDLNDLLSKSARNVDLRAKLGLKQDEATKKTELGQKLFKELQQEASSLALVLDSVDNCDKVVETVWKDKDQQCRQLLVQEMDLQNQLQHLNAELTALQVELNQKLVETEENEFPLDLPQQLQELEHKFQKECAQKSSHLAMVQLYESFIHCLQTNHDCPVCDRQFGSRTEAEEAVAKLHNRVNEIKNQNGTDDGETLKILEREYDNMKSLRPKWDIWNHSVNVDIPKLKHQISTVQSDISQLKKQLEELPNRKITIQSEERKLALLKKKAEDYTRQHRELKVLSNQLAALTSELELELGSSSTGNEKSFEQLQQTLSNEQDQMRALQMQIDNLIGEQRSRQADLIKCQMHCQNLKEQILKAQMQSSDLINIQSQIKDTKGHLNSINEDLVKTDNSLNEISKDIVRFEENRQQLLVDEKTQLEAIKSEHQCKVDTLNMLKLESREFNSPQSFSQLQALIKDLQDQTTRIDERINLLSKELSVISEQHANQGKESAELEMTLRQIRDNQRLRELQSKRTLLNNKMTDLKQQVSDRGRQDLVQIYQRAQMRHSDLLGERSGLLGELKQLEDQQQRYQAELNSEYPDVDSVYRNQYAKCTSAQMAADDLDRYGKALDTAIMRYHATKMDEINRIIRELWTCTYQGADIDTIEIRADKETTTTNTTTSNRSYNYRVVMLVKGGERELDMRGRSSAGQRVLASLVIRLALAETFALQCGVLALDEPTTNLDRDNIEALAQALGDLVKSRKQQHNFQLVIITHDEDFVSLLHRHQCAEYYWRIDKDDQQRSIIERQSMQTY